MSSYYIKWGFGVIVLGGLLLYLRNNYWVAPVPIPAIDYVKLIGESVENPGPGQAKSCFDNETGNCTNSNRSGGGVPVQPSNYDKCHKETRCRCEEQADCDLKELKCLLLKGHPPSQRAKRQIKELSRMIQKRFHHLQNPVDCNQAKKLICSLKAENCGLGCQINHVVYCMVVAYATSRTLILKSRHKSPRRAWTLWPYTEDWNDVFLPLSESCTNYSRDGGHLKYWEPGNEKDDDAQVLFLRTANLINEVPAFLPPALPSDIARRLEKLHGQPDAWWTGQFVRYLLRLRPEMQAILDEAKTKMGIRSPIVGVHVRRTDKIKHEAKSYPLREYMKYVKEYFAIRESRSLKGPVNRTRSRPRPRRVFIATDDPKVLKEARKMYPFPEWKIIGNTSVARSGLTANRYREKGGLIGIVIDLFLLSECDFMVCTFSSNVCRVAYVMMQTKRVDGSHRAVSLDARYQFHEGSKTIQKAQLPHTPFFSNEIELQVGDVVVLRSYELYGMANGTNLRTKKDGLYPTCKVQNVYVKLDFPLKKWWSRSPSEKA